METLVTLAPLMGLLGTVTGIMRSFTSMGCAELSVFFFFQAEDGIRDYKVTGVQTCALPIWIRRGTSGGGSIDLRATPTTTPRGAADDTTPYGASDDTVPKRVSRSSVPATEIGRGSGRERV